MDIILPFFDHLHVDILYLAKNIDRNISLQDNHHYRHLTVNTQSVARLSRQQLHLVIYFECLTIVYRGFTIFGHSLLFYLLLFNFFQLFQAVHLLLELCDFVDFLFFLFLRQWSLLNLFFVI